MTAELDLTELLVGHSDSGLMLIRVQDCLDFEPGARLGAANQINDGLRKEPALDLVPLAGSRRIVTDRDRYADLIRHLLQVDLPGAQAISLFLHSEQALGTVSILIVKIKVERRTFGAIEHFPVS